MTAVRILQTGDWHPGWFQQPSLFAYLVTAAMGFYFAYGRAIGYFATAADLFRPDYHHYWGPVPFPGQFHAPRLLSALLGVASVWLLYQLGRRLAGRRVGLIAALVLAVSYLHVRSSHFVTNDVAATLLVLATVLCAVRMVRDRGATRWYLLAGLFSGLAASTRYNYALAVVPVAVAHLARVLTERQRLLQWPIFAAGAASIAGFFAGTPYALLDAPGLVSGLAYEAEHHLSAGHIGAEGRSGRWLVLHLLAGSERWMTLLGVVGLGQMLLRKLRVYAVVVSFPVAYFLLMARSLVHFERFLVPLVPFLALGTALAVGGLLHHTLAGHGTAGSLVRLLLLLAIVGEPFAAAALYDLHLTQTDVQVKAAEWVMANLPRGATVVAERYGAPLSPDDFELLIVQGITDHDLAWYREQGAEYFVFGALRYRHIAEDRRRYADEFAEYQRYLGHLTLVQRLTGPFVGWPDYDVAVYRWRDDDV